MSDSANGYVELYFPIRVQLLDDKADYTGPLGSVNFENGISELLSYRVAKNFSMNYKVAERTTGIRFHPATERAYWRVGQEDKGRNMHWHYVGPLSPKAQEIEDAYQAELAAGVANSPARPALEPAQSQEAGEASTPAVLAEAAPEAPVEIDLDKAAEAQQVDLLLSQLRDKHGARYLRQLCEAFGVETARSADTMTDSLLKSGKLTLANLASFVPKDKIEPVRLPNEPTHDTQGRLGDAS